MEEISLYGYQEEVVQPALQGRNIIIWLPTGGGKTRAAVYVAKRHLESRPGAKVAVLVNKVHLVDQHYSKEFQPFLGERYKIASISGDCDQKDFFGPVLQNNDVIICTAQILENSLRSIEEDKHVELTDFTLLIIDECHHTNKENVYNKIMQRYVQAKPRGGLPQVLGLTASLGTGGAKTFQGAKKHVLQICANLDASAIVSPKENSGELQRNVPKPVKKYDIVNERPEDPFGDHLKSMMSEMHDYAAVKTFGRNFGSQEYEADVVQLEKQASVDGNRMLAQCALHLRQYNDALLINDTVRMADAFRVLEEFYSAETERRIGLDDTDRFLFNLFQENKARLQTLAALTQYENPKLEQLQKTMLEHFGGQNKSRGILFSKTRVSTHCLFDWVSANHLLQEASIKAAVLTGAGNQASHMTQKGQRQTIQQFREGSLNLLISTSVAEEGLDIPECNLVVRYGLLTNEIAMQQASGRARAGDSVYSVVARAGGQEVRRERTNEYLEELSSKAIAEVQSMDQLNFQQQVEELQGQSVIALRLAELQLRERRSRCPASSVRLLCRLCFTPVAHGNDIQLIDGVHYVNINPNFEVYYKAGEKVELERTFEDWEPGRVISCADCGRDWGMEMIYKEVTLPNLAIKNFVLESPDGRKPVEKWKNVPFCIEEFKYTDYVLKKFPDLL
ncbi:ATP-dependent RNA helicase DHX58-like isoform X1 [Conger conger]|uniref:ATP-dependent RNA helicase DHX58-like isoform X1 n=1 Tax=Conger conger TaxID=82655 RepID=UPI002A5ADA6D|nr:ATP-dependent RNA helicase DHX58-like isoform X1 [Conger conger]XP_061080325.1 ATP-dependent RNA helicase DHX58-like isoform X1 [Conger conger]